MTKARLWLILALLAVFAAGGAYLASPMFAFKALANAAEAGDRDRLERLVDFPAVRDSLKTQLRARLLSAFAGDRGLSEGPFGQLGALLGPAIVDQVVNAAVTADGIAAIVRSGRAPLSDVGASAPPEPPPAAAPGLPGPPPVAAHAAKEKRSTRFAYVDLDHFKATTITGGASKAPLGWVLERRGLMGWKLVRIELPPE